MDVCVGSESGWRAGGEGGWRIHCFCFFFFPFLSFCSFASAMVQRFGALHRKEATATAAARSRDRRALATSRRSHSRACRRRRCRGGGEASLLEEVREGMVVMVGTLLVARGKGERTARGVSVRRVTLHERRCLGRVHKLQDFRGELPILVSVRATLHRAEGGVLLALRDALPVSRAAGDGAVGIAPAPLAEFDRLELLAAAVRAVPPWTQEIVAGAGPGTLSDKRRETLPRTPGRRSEDRTVAEGFRDSVPEALGVVEVLRVQLRRSGGHGAAVPILLALVEVETVAGGSRGDTPGLAGEGGVGLHEAPVRGGPDVMVVVEVRMVYAVVLQEQTVRPTGGVHRPFL